MKRVAHAFGMAVAFACGMVSLLGANPPIRILPLGDSITKGCCNGTSVEGGYRTRLNTLLVNSGYTVDFLGSLHDQDPPPGLPDPDHEGHGGFRTDEIDAGINTWLNQVDDPDVILLLIGVNDYWQNYDTAHAANRLDALIGHLATARPYAKIIVANLLLFTANPAVDSAIQTSYNPRIPIIVANHQALGQQVTFLDLRSCCGAADLNDGVHPTITGYSKVGEKWFEAITSVISPMGTANPPAILRSKGQVDLRRVAITFSKPVSDSSAQVGNFSLSGGLSVLGASLDSSKRVITLTTSVQAINTTYTVTVNGVTDRTAQANAIAPDSTSTFQSGPVAEASNYSLVYSLKVQNQVDYNSEGVPYAVDNSGSLGVFSRIAYYLELQPLNAGPAQYVWASMNAFTSDPERLGVPNISSGAFFQQNVIDLNVRSSVPGVVTGDGLSGGNLEFWAADYGPNNAAAVPGASDTLFDFGDGAIFGDPAGYGSMQLHNRSAGQTIFSFNGWGGAGLPVDLGIGNNSGGIQPDWTLKQNGATYGSKLLEVYVVTGSNSEGLPTITTQPSSLTVGMGGNATFNVVASGIGPLTYQWRRNGIAIGGATESSYTLNNAPVGSGGSYDVLVSNANGSTTSSAAVLTVTEAGILANGSFESGYGGWMQSGNQMVFAAAPYQATAGKFLVVFNGGDRAPNGVLLQSFATTPGLTYTLAFDAGVIGSGGKQQRLQVLVQGRQALVSQILTVTTRADGTIQWIGQGYTFVADSSVTTVTFQDVSSATQSVDLLLDNVRVTSPSTPVIWEQPLSVTADVGGHVTLRVLASGLGPLSYQWRFNGAPISGAVEPQLAVENIQLTNAGVYDVVVGNPAGATTSAPAIMTVISSGLLANGSFELGYSGWTASGHQVVATTDGTYVAIHGTNMVVFNPGQASPDAVLSQSFVTEPGRTYVVSFAMGVISWNLNPQRLQIVVTGTVPLFSQELSLVGTGNGSIKWTSPSFTFAADSEITTLTFQDVSTVGQNLDLLLDDVRVSLLPRVLSVHSINPSSGVNFRVTPLDNNGAANGVATFTRTYGDGTLVNVLAPKTAAGNTFQKWQQDGVDLTKNPRTSVLMDANHSMTAIFVPTRTLTVNSLNVDAGVRVRVAPADNNGTGEGVTSFTRSYGEGTLISLIAPATTGSSTFKKWQLDGVDLSASSRVSIVLDANHTLTAVY